MKLYLLVEGVSSEMQVYPSWINYFLPDLEHYNEYEKFKQANSGFYLISGYGYPSILNHINNAATNVHDIGDVDHFFIILDQDEDTVEARRAIVENELKKFTFPSRVNVHIIIQSRCFETILLANRAVISRQPNNEPFITFFRYYNVIDNDPELMGNFSSDQTHSQFHAKYAIQALREKRIKYSKSNCSEVATSDFIRNIDQRITTTPHLSGFRVFVDILKSIHSRMLA